MDFVISVSPTGPFGIGPAIGSNGACIGHCIHASVQCRWQSCLTTPLIRIDVGGVWLVATMVSQGLATSSPADSHYPVVV